MKNIQLELFSYGDLNQLQLNLFPDEPVKEVVREIKREREGKKEEKEIKIDKKQLKLFPSETLQMELFPTPELSIFPDLSREYEEYYR